MLTHFLTAVTWAAAAARQDPPARLTLIDQTSQNGPIAELINPRRLAIDLAGRVYVGDEGPARVVVLRGDGSHLRTIGREGGGPGEFRSAMPAVNGAALFVYDPIGSRISLFDTTGHLKWAKTGPCCRAYSVSSDQAGRFYVLRAPINLSGGLEGDLMVVDQRGSFVDSLTLPNEERRQAIWRSVDDEAAVSYPVPFGPRRFVAVTPVGTVVTGFSSEYRLVELRSFRDTIRIAQNEWSRVAVPESARRASVESAVAELNRFVPEAQLRSLFNLGQVPSTLPAFSGLEIDPCGRWWVLRDPGVSGTIAFDVFNSGAQLVATARAAGRMLQPPRWAVGRDIIAFVTEGAEGAPRVQIWKVQPANVGCRK